MKFKLTSRDLGMTAFGLGVGVGSTFAGTKLFKIAEEHIRLNKEAGKAEETLEDLDKPLNFPKQK